MIYILYAQYGVILVVEGINGLIVDISEDPNGIIVDRS